MKNCCRLDTDFCVNTLLLQGVVAVLATLVRQLHPITERERWDHLEPSAEHTSNHLHVSDVSPSASSLSPTRALRNIHHLVSENRGRQGPTMIQTDMWPTYWCWWINTRSKILTDNVYKQSFCRKESNWQRRTTHIEHYCHRIVIYKDLTKYWNIWPWSIDMYTHTFNEASLISNIW